VNAIIACYDWCMSRLLLSPLPGWLLFSLLLVLATAPAHAADVVVDSNTRYQTIDGFGTCTYLYGDDDTTYETPEFQDWYLKDLGASLMRMEFHPDAEPQEDLDLDNLNFDKLQMNTRNVAVNGKLFASLQEHKLDQIKFLGSLWTPPAWMKDDNANSHDDKGTITIDFTPIVNFPVINAIEVIPQTP
jgi:O-glycosyl hydrolase